MSLGLVWHLVRWPFLKAPQVTVITHSISESFQGKEDNAIILSLGFILWKDREQFLSNWFSKSHMLKNCLRGFLTGRVLGPRGETLAQVGPRSRADKYPRCSWSRCNWNRPLENYCKLLTNHFTSLSLLHRLQIGATPIPVMAPSQGHYGGWMRMGICKLQKGCEAGFLLLIIIILTR